MSARPPAPQGQIDAVLNFTAADQWSHAGSLAPVPYVCAYCAWSVASNQGYYCQGEAGQPAAFIRICGNCKGPTFFSRNGTRYPGEAPGETVKHVPPDITSLYQEARLSASAGSNTGSVMLCRKILMHVAVSLGDAPGKRFIEYVEYLAATGYIPPNGKKWVDHIRTKSNEANHEIVLSTLEDAQALIRFTGMLLKFIYELPSSVP